MKLSIQSLLSLFIFTLFTFSSYSQNVDFSDREAVIKTTENFFIGDHTASVKHKKLSMHEKGAYRFIKRDGTYDEYVFNLDSAEADTSYKEEILSVEIYGKLALVRARLAANNGKAHYKLFTMHKTGNNWKITTITWGTGIKL